MLEQGLVNNFFKLLFLKMKFENLFANNTKKENY